jgi:lipid A 3-O-deacylase
LHAAPAALLRIAAVILACMTAPALAAEPRGEPGGETSSLLSPTSAFVQAGAAEEAQMLVLGATWEWDWHRDYSIGRMTGYWEGSFGRWNSDGLQSGDAWVTQLGITPVLRLHPHAWGGGWFVEMGIGANLLLPVYQSRSKRFSTTFNFGDHLAIGRRFGQNDRHEVALRIQHFSNAGIREPNPGEDFVQIRYSRRF